MSVDTCIAPAVITCDNFHLSKAIPTRSATGASASNLLSACADSKVLAFVAAATSVNTHRAYESDLAHYLSWGGCIPSAPQLVAQYLATHAESLSMATLARRIVSIRRAHVFGGFPDPTKAELVRLALRGVRRLHGRPQRRVAPLRLEHLGDIVSRLGSEKRDLRDRALLLVGFAGAFRRSELTAIDCSQIERRERGIIITLPRSKTDQEGRGRQVAIVRVGGPICPGRVGWLADDVRNNRWAAVSAGQQGWQGAREAFVYERRRNHRQAARRPGRARSATIFGAFATRCIRHQRCRRRTTRLEDQRPDRACFGCSSWSLYSRSRCL